MEILAPAGGPAALEAALGAGADAVYLGLRQLNARRGAENFAPESLPATVAAVHARGARVYLTLNIDLAQRELGQAARQLELARQAGVDAVLVRDAALLALRPLYPKVEFHLSTQAGVCSSAGTAAARGLGCCRVVLARELDLAEIAAAAAVPGIETEVFVQGALCFCVSGHCLLSSWGGGRSGNRGTCTSPCRVLWTRDDGPPLRHLSMHDLCAVDRLPALAAAGARSLKIEGRLKTPEWVARAVGLYRRALAGGTTAAELRQAAVNLGAYTGRQLTTGYLDGERGHLTGDAARPVGPGPGEGATPAACADSAGAAAAIPDTSWRVCIGPDAHGGLLWRVQLASAAWEKRTPHQPVRNRERAVTLAETVARLTAALPREAGLAAPAVELGDPGACVPRSTANAFVRDVLALVRRVQREPDGVVRTSLPDAVRAALAPGAAAPENRRSLGAPPTRVRLDAGAVAAMAAALPTSVTVVVEGAQAADVPALAARLPGRGRVALPAVLFEGDLAGVRRLLAACAAAGVPAEVNGWDGWWLARQAGVACDAGPGLGVLNALAARQLARLGCAAATVSPEADRGQVETLCAAADVPLLLQVFGRPPLLQTRVELALPPGGARFRDRRGTELLARREGSVTVFRPLQPYSWCDLRNPAVHVAHLVVDLVGSPAPAAEWAALAAGTAPRLRFNYDRSLR